MARGRKKDAGKPDGAEAAGFVPTMPEGLGPASAAKWARLVPLIAAQVSLKEVDADALRQYCEASVWRAKAAAELEAADSLLMANPNGAEYANPLVKIISQQEAVMLRLSERFGLDPASRRRLQLESAKSDDVFAEFLKRGRTGAKPEVEEG
jgi:P27 family predicted phage terminase small subunit